MTLMESKWRRPIALCLPPPPDIRHAAAVADVAEGVASALRGLGHAVRVLDAPGPAPGETALVMLPNLLTVEWLAALPDDTILYNFERIDGPNDRNPVFLDGARRFTVWDYSRRNIDLLRPKLPHDRLLHVPVGHAAVLERIAMSPVEDIDVLFYGCLTSRRSAVLRQMVARGLTVRAVFGRYGAERDRLIARSKLVLNVHHDLPSPLETVRLGYALSNRRAVLTELGPQTAFAGEEDLLPGLATAPYEGLAEAAEALVTDPAERRRLALRGYEAIRRRDTTALVAKALALS